MITHTHTHTHIHKVPNLNVFTHFRSTSYADGAANPPDHTENRQKINSFQQKQPVQEGSMEGQSFLESW